MAEVGSVTCASIALRMGQAALPASRSTCSKHRFQQPQLLTMLCLMRDEDWPFREAEVRLAEHGELRTALGLDHAPDYTTLSRLLRRLDETILEEALSAVVRQLVPRPSPPATADRTRRPVEWSWSCPGLVDT